MKKIDYLFSLLLIVVYIGLLFWLHPGAFKYHFDTKLLEKYKRSQDIPHEVKNRIFLSDSDIHISAGYLYVHGDNPTEYNFQHPPLVKYLFGLSTLSTQNPLYVQFVLGSLFIVFTYLLGLFATKNRYIALLTCLFLIADPLFLDTSTIALLDLGQATFTLLYVLSFFFFPSNFLIQGLALGLSAASKFWTPTLFFMALVLIIQVLMKKKINIKFLALSYTVALIVFALNYLKVFIDKQGFFNLAFFQVKILKYWLNHSVSAFPGMSLVLFVSGYMREWWGKKQWTYTGMWNVLWPISLVVASVLSYIRLQKRLIMPYVLFIIPLAYLIYISFQAPFTRYFLMILPYCYLALAYSIVKIGFVFIAQLKKK